MGGYIDCGKKGFLCFFDKGETAHALCSCSVRFDASLVLLRINFLCPKLMLPQGLVCISCCLRGKRFRIRSLIVDLASRAKERLYRFFMNA